ncbi:MAG TPA: selenide, water dikinase SelD [Gemmatimonadaceae bacterium]
MGPGDLSKALEGLPHHHDPRLIVGHETMDDAGVFVVSDDLALVQTVDFFAPIVDDPYLFGQVAAANALSDVFAMGGEPLTALNIVGFPSGKLPLEVLREILRGGQEKVHEAGALVVGGHTIIDEELKYGLSVTGRAHPAKLLTNAGARPGDRLVLTKAIGTALLATLAKKGQLPDAEMRSLAASMSSLNAAASRAALAVAARCATDITGFGLLGHASHIARASNVTLRIRVAAVPILPGAREAADRGVRTGGADRNLAYLQPMVNWGSASETDRILMIDPQTSGGLLVAMPPADVAKYLSLVPAAVEIGDVVAARPTGIELV